MIPTVLVVGALFGFGSIVARRLWIALAGLGIVGVLWPILVVPGRVPSPGISNLIQDVVVAMAFGVGNYLVGLGAGLLIGAAARAVRSGASRLMGRS